MPIQAPSNFGATDPGAELASIERQRRYADILRQQSLQPLDTNQMAGGWVIPTSPFAGAAKALNAYAANRKEKGADERQQALANALRSDRTQALTEAQQLAEGTPGHADIPAPSDALGGGPGAPAEAPKGPDYAAAIRRLAQSQDPTLQAAGTQGMLTQMQQSAAQAEMARIMGQSAPRPGMPGTPLPQAQGASQPPAGQPLPQAQGMPAGAPATGPQPLPQIPPQGAGRPPVGAPPIPQGAGPVAPQAGGTGSPSPAQIQQMLLSPNPQVQAMAKSMMATMKPEGGVQYDQQGNAYTLNALGQKQALPGVREHISANTQATLDQAEKHFNSLSPYQQAKLKNEAARLGISRQELSLRQNAEKVPAGYRTSSTEPGKLEFIPGGPADPNTKEGKLGNRESVYLSRVMNASNEVAKDLENVVRLPLTSSTGIFGGRQQGGSLLSAGKESLTNAMTSQEVQSYNTLASGFQRNLASIEAAGLAPSGTLSHQMDAVMFKQGDTNMTKLQKLAQTRQIVEAGLETALANPRVPDAQRTEIKRVIDNVRKSVPFNNGDILKLTQAQQIDPAATLNTVLGKGGGKSSIQNQADAILSGGKP